VTVELLVKIGDNDVVKTHTHRHTWQYFDTLLSSSIGRAERKIASAAL
jgi:hypothetical protein